ncbi:MFS transporter [Pseudonocardia acaciae]|uniref:MFS transporter n=1 Tax=Pseudonocardia acaciae TaxID=551276 RepID=UPI00055CFBD2|nr:MFS transporter [Pseudonocardia acaciae]
MTRPATAEPTRTARATVLAAATLTIMAAAIIAPSLPAMRQEFADVAGVDLLVRLALTVTSLAIAISAPLSGVVADRLGRRPLLVAGLALYAVSGAAGFFVTDLVPLLVSRALLGVAVGGIMTAVSATITDWFDGPRRASFLGLQQAAASLGGVVFLPLAGALAAVSWKAPFWLYTISAVLVPFALLAVHEPSEPGEPGEQRRGAAAGRPVAPGGNRHPGRIAGIYALALVATLAFYMAPTQLPFLLVRFDAGPTLVGAVIAGSTLTGGIAAVAFQPVRRRLSATAITAVSLALLGVGWALVGLADALALVVLGLLVGGVGVGLIVPNLNLRLAELAGPDRRGRVLSGLVTGIFLGQFLSPLVVQPLLQAAGIAGAFTWSGVALALGAFGAALASGRHTHRKGDR